MQDETKEIKYNVFKLAWYMRGGVDAHDLFWEYSAEDRIIINDIIKENIESTNKTGLPLV
jgi:glycyl-tRNA synthetase alpha subunit